MNSSKDYDVSTGQYIVYYKMPGCSFCNSFDSVWQQFKEKLNKSHSNITVLEVSTEKGGNNVVGKNAPHVNAFPSVYSFNNGQATPLNDSRTLKNLMKAQRLLKETPLRAYLCV